MSCFGLVTPSQIEKNHGGLFSSTFCSDSPFGYKSRSFVDLQIYACHPKTTLKPQVSNVIENLIEFINVHLRAFYFKTFPLEKTHQKCWESNLFISPQNTLFDNKKRRGKNIFLYGEHTILSEKLVSYIKIDPRGPEN